MGRTYLLFIVIAGALGAMLSQGLPQASSGGAEVVHRLELEQKDDADRERIAASSQEGTVELVRSANGHFFADVEINGAPVRMLVDTGATGIALSREDARSAGIATSIGMHEVVGRGADGDVKGEFVTIDRVKLGHMSAEDMEAVVLSTGEQSLLGQNFLSKFASVEIQGDKMLLR